MSFLENDRGECAGGIVMEKGFGCDEAGGAGACLSMPISKRS